MIKWDHISTGCQIIIGIAILAFCVTQCTSRQKETAERRPHGSATFMYSAGGCNVYSIKDGNGENSALLTRCPKTTITTSERQEGVAENAKKVRVDNTLEE